MAEEIKVESGLPADMLSGAGLDLSEASVASEEQVKLVSDLSSVVSVAKPTGVPYVEIETSEFILASRIFLQNKISTSDILSRAALVEFKDKTASLSMSDGLMRTHAEFPVLEKTADFPASVIVDIETLHRIAQVQGKKFYLVAKDEQFYIDFFGGRIYIPTYNIPVEILRYVKGEAQESHTFATERILAALQVAAVYSSSIGIPDLSFAFYEKDAMFLANGYSVFKVAGNFCNMAIRKNDLPLISYALQLSLKQDVKVDFMADRLTFNSPVMAVQIPRVNTTLSQDFKNMLASVPVGGFNVSFARLLTVLSIFERMPQSSGVVFFKNTTGPLIAYSKTRDGKESYVELSSVKEGDIKIDMYLSTKNLIGVLRAFRPANMVNFTVKGDSLFISAGDRVVCIFGKGL